MVVLQLFLIYVRLQAKATDDRTAITMSNPLSGLLAGDGSGAATGNAGMMKQLASSFLASQTTVVEYDLAQARNMQGGILFNMAFMWFLHFKMEQVQPLILQTVNGFINLVYSPLFQVYVLGRSLERPFKTQAAVMQQAAAEAAAAAEEDNETSESSEVAVAATTATTTNDVESKGKSSTVKKTTVVSKKKKTGGTKASAKKTVKEEEENDILTETESDSDEEEAETDSDDDDEEESDEED